MPHLFENLVGGSTPPPERGGRVHTISYLSFLWWQFLYTKNLAKNQLLLQVLSSNSTRAFWPVNWISVYWIRKKTFLLPYKWIILSFWAISNLVVHLRWFKNIWQVCNSITFSLQIQNLFYIKSCFLDTMLLLIR